MSIQADPLRAHICLENRSSGQSQTCHFRNLPSFQKVTDVKYEDYEKPAGFPAGCV